MPSVAGVRSSHSLLSRLYIYPIQAQDKMRQTDSVSILSGTLLCQLALFVVPTTRAGSGGVALRCAQTASRSLCKTRDYTHALLGSLATGQGTRYSRLFAFM